MLERCTECRNFHLWVYPSVKVGLKSHENQSVHMKTTGKGHYWEDFWISNEDISGTRRAMGTFESALESWNFILFDDRIFETLEYSTIDPQMKIGHMSIYEKSGKNTKSRLDKRIWRVNCDIFFLKEIYDDTFRKKFRWYPKWYPQLKFWVWSHKIGFFKYRKWRNFKRT